jgi:hypothetical protein
MQLVLRKLFCYALFFIHIVATSLRCFSIGEFCEFVFLMIVSVLVFSGFSGIFCGWHALSGLALQPGSGVSAIHVLLCLFLWCLFLMHVYLVRWS